MSLYRRGKKGLFWYEFEFERTRYRGNAGTNQRRTAERIEADAKAKVALGVRDIGTHTPKPFTAVASEFRRLVEQKAQGVYLTNVLYQLAFWDTIFADAPVDELTLPAIEAAKRKLISRSLSSATVNRYLATLRSVLNYALEAGYIERNPARARGLFLAEPPARDRILTVEEQTALLEHCATPLRQLVTVALMTGCRAGELAVLRWDEHVNLRDRVVTLKAENTKTRRARAIPLNRIAVEVMMTLPRYADVPVFLHSEDYLGRTFQRAVKAAGLTGRVTLHTLRHTVATRLDAAGVPLGVRAALLGHSTQGTTLRHYTHPEFESLRRAVEVLEKCSADAQWSPKISPQASVSY